MQTLKILLVSNNYLPYSGGVVSALQLLLDELKKMGHDVRLITLDFGVPTIDQENVVRIPSLFTFSYKKNRMAVPRQAKRFLSEYIKKFNPDVVHVHHPFLLGPIVVECAKRLHIPIVFTYHTQYEQYAHYVPLLPAHLVKKYINNAVYQFCQSVDAIIAPTATIKNQLKKKRIKTPIKVIATPIASFFFDQKNQRKENSEKFSLLCVSRFVPEKNLFFLLDVLKMLGQNKFTLTLVGYGSLYDELREYAFHKLKLSPDILFFVEKPSKEKLIIQYHKADLFLFASTTETQGMVLAEAMASGLPVVAVNAPGSRDIIENGVNGFLVETRDEMKKSIECIATNKELQSILKNNALTTAQKYRAKLGIEQLIKLYQGTIENELHPHPE
ncbi:MAG: Alpha-monoglucosyldiacylglycerol synthase [Candidatus Dependentiae bacterium ADurb.Bin331]|nr:MAG: Alpha-monoglucosyldiacylglycerol synthase [Candidatus Dependentiae bacterium ADurb.Bin331]